MGESHCTTRSPGSVRWQCGDLVGQRASKVLTHGIVHFYHQNGLIDLRMMEDRRIRTGSAAYSTPGSHGRLDQQQARPALRGLPKVEAAGEEAAVLPWCSPSSVVRLTLPCPLCIHPGPPARPIEAPSSLQEQHTFDLKRPP